MVVVTVSVAPVTLNSVAVDETETDGSPGVAGLVIDSDFNGYKSVRLAS